MQLSETDVELRENNVELRETNVELRKTKCCVVGGVCVVVLRITPHFAITEGGLRQTHQRFFGSRAPLRYSFL